MRADAAPSAIACWRGGGHQAPSEGTDNAADGGAHEAMASTSNAVLTLRTLIPGCLSTGVL